MTRFAKEIVVWLVLWIGGCVLFDALLGLTGGWLMLGGVITYEICSAVQKRMRFNAEVSRERSESAWLPCWQAAETTEIEMAKLNEWEQGVLMAASVLVATHDQPGMAADIIKELGLNDADCSDLDDFDKRNLQRVNGQRGAWPSLRGLHANA